MLDRRSPYLIQVAAWWTEESHPQPGVCSRWVRCVAVSAGGTTEPPPSRAQLLPCQGNDSRPGLWCQGVKMLVNKHLVCYLAYNFPSNAIKRVQTAAAETEDARKISSFCNVSVQFSGHSLPPLRKCWQGLGDCLISFIPSVTGVTMETGVSQ